MFDRELVLESLKNIRTAIDTIMEVIDRMTADVKAVE